MCSVVHGVLSAHISRLKKADIMGQKCLEIIEASTPHCVYSAASRLMFSRQRTTLSIFRKSIQSVCKRICRALLGDGERKPVGCELSQALLPD